MNPKRNNNTCVYAAKGWMAFKSYVEVELNKIARHKNYPLVLEDDVNQPP